MRALLLIPLLALLAACLPIPGLFYIGQLSDHDQSIFREAARIEGVDTADWPVPGATVVVYGRIADQGEISVPLTMIFISRTYESPCSNGGRDQSFLIASRHALGHAKGKLHSDNPNRVMHSPPPCDPID